MNPVDNVILACTTYLDRMPSWSRVTYPDLAYQVKKQLSSDLSVSVIEGLCRGIVNSRSDVSVYRGRGIVKH